MDSRTADNLLQAGSDYAIYAGSGGGKMKDGKLMEPGKWCTIFDGDGNVVTTVYDESFRRLLGYGPDEYADGNEAWAASIHPEDAERVRLYFADCCSKHPEGMDYDIEYRMMTKRGYRWFHDFAHCERREDGSIIRCDGAAFDIQEGLDKVDIINHEKLRSDVFSYMIDYEDDPVELLRTFAERLRVLIDCDQVIYRDLEETRIMVNSPEIEKTWSVPIEYCKQCEHFDAHHPMYKDGYTEMSNCQEGWEGIPVYKDCPIKSSLTRLVYCDGEIAGYLAIHYVQKYHDFTDIERATLQEFSRILSMSLSRYEAKKRAGELNSVKKTLSMTFALSDQFDPIIVIDPRTGEYDWLMSVAQDVIDNTSMTQHGDDLYKNIGIDGASLIHEEDRTRFQAFYTRENLLKIAETGEPQETENRWFIQSEGRYKWKYNKAVRMTDENGKVYVVIGVIDTTEEKIKEEEFSAQKRLYEEQRAVSENAARFFALEDSFESLYDVELESGHYVSYDRDEFYKKNVSDLVVSSTEFFRDLRTNVERVVYEEDREAVYSIQTREAMIRGLAEKDHIDHYYRIITDNGPMWLKMRIVYKDAEKKNVIVGIFNAEEEMAARQQEEHFKEELIQNNTRLFALEDNFESLYDVEMESGHYDVFVKGDFFRNHVIDKLSVPNDYFEELRANIDAVIFHEDRDGLYYTLTRESIRRELAESDHFDYYYRIVSENGPVWFKMRIVYKDADRKNVIIGVFNAENDIEAQQIADQNAQLEKDMQLISGLASGYDALYYINIDEGNFSVYTFNEEKYPDSLKAFGEKLDFYELIRKYGHSEHIHPDDRKLFDDFTPETIRTKLSSNKKYSIRFRIDAGNGYRWDEMDLIKYENADEPANAVAVGFADRDSDIRREQEYQQTLENAREAADAANQSKTNFLFNMSHDIRTPMNAIRGFTAMAKKHSSNEEKVNEYLEKIDISGQQLLTLINQVLEMARIESGKMEFDEKPINVREEFNSMITVLSEQAKGNGLNFVHILSDIKHENVLADEARMSSVTLNIIGNAMKYTPEGGTVEFNLKEIPGRKPGYATFVFTVADTGIGMSQEYLERLYEPFSRENNSTVSKIQGTGLGMSIVKSTIDLMGGNIEVRSEPGKGTRFDITIDFKIDENAVLSAEASEETGTVSFKGRRVLLVEDNEMNREIARDILEEQGLIVEDADDGDIAVAMMQAIVDRGEFHYYDFVLMDVQMPRMNGYEATKAIRAIPGPEGVHVPIIAMTANAFEEDRQNALAAGMDEHLAKPIDVQKLFKTIARFL